MEYKKVITAKQNFLVSDDGVFEIFHIFRKFNMQIWIAEKKKIGQNRRAYYVIFFIASKIVFICYKKN